MARARRVPAQGHALRVTRPAALARCLRPKCLTENELSDFSGL
ncbi:hypothetical protein SXCC_02375 [Gluconacetobacter sp. SXCC-1]|nr:hypothetical protein SXCC_02375 [Gluconacetobacter sp. SXCC-1]